MSERTRRNSLTYHEQMRDAESECVPCKLCGGKAIITDAGAGFGYNIECENAARFKQQTCLQSGTRISGWAYNVSDMWNRLNALTPQIDTIRAVQAERDACADVVTACADAFDKVAEHPGVDTAGIRRSESLLRGIAAAIRARDPAAIAAKMKGAGDDQMPLGL